MDYVLEFALATLCDGWVVDGQPVLSSSFCKSYLNASPRKYEVYFGERRVYALSYPNRVCFYRDADYRRGNLGAMKLSAQTRRFAKTDVYEMRSSILAATKA